jgi:hypothetical protein
VQLTNAPIPRVFPLVAPASCAFPLPCIECSRMFPLTYGSSPVTPSFQANTRCSSYVCPGSICHTYGQNVNTENQYLYYINIITWFLHRRLYRLSHRSAAEHTNPTGNRPGATQASRRNLHRSNSSCLQLLSSVTARGSRLMVATQQV